MGDQQYELSADIRIVLDRAQARRVVLLHCHAGVGRTGTLLHAYYLTEGLSLEEARVRVRAGRLSSQFLLLSDAQQSFLQDLAREMDRGG